MAWNNEQEHTTFREYGSYTGFSHYQEPSYTQQQAYQEPSYTQQQQAYQQARPMYEQPAVPIASSSNDDRVAATLSYALGWLSGLLFLLYGARKPFVRFHALQSLIFFGAINLIDVVLMRLIFFIHYYLGYPWAFFFFAFLLLNFVGFVGWIVAMVQASQGKYYKMPIVGHFLEKTIKWPTSPRW